MDPAAYPLGYFPFIEYDYFQGRAQCTVCGRLLVFAPGCALVQCSNCASVLSLRHFGARGQVLCSGCGKMILFPLGFTAVQCSHCDTTTEIQPLRYYSCEGCSLYLTYANGPASRVMCTVCNTLRDVRSEDTEETAWREAREAEAAAAAGPSRRRPRGDGGPRAEEAKQLPAGGSVMEQTESRIEEVGQEAGPSEQTGVVEEPQEQPAGAETTVEGEPGSLEDQGLPGGGGASEEHGSAQGQGSRQEQEPPPEGGPAEEGSPEDTDVEALVEDTQSVSIDDRPEREEGEGGTAAGDEQGP